jgi:hypothetical protein
MTDGEAIAAWNTRATPRTDGDDGEQPAPYRCKHGCERDELMDRITALSAEVERLRGLFAGLAIDADACAVARQYARAALGAKP